MEVAAKGAWSVTLRSRLNQTCTKYALLGS